MYAHLISTLAHQHISRLFLRSLLSLEFFFDLLDIDRLRYRLEILQLERQSSAC